MSLVVDTSVIISVITNEKSKSKLIEITKGVDLISPSSLHWEIGNAFSAMFKRKRIDLKTAKKAIEYYEMIPIRLLDIDINKSVEIAHQYGLYAYDAYFLECARNYNAQLLTIDGGLTLVAKQMDINVIEV
ncbi:MAG TPA: PIN domain-containing protein [Ignavibacteria bacterium]|nr:PIN domain-containing protein [Ignavibacteria bacterium]